MNRNNKNKLLLLDNMVLYYVLPGIVALLIYHRISATISTGDETMQVAQAYKIAMGYRPFVDMWELFQTGSILQAPIIFLYIKITGNTDGIILFSRVSYLFMNIILFYVCACLLKKVVGKLKAVLIGLALMTYAPYCLYYLWYDTVMIYFGFIGTILIICAMADDTKICYKRKFLFFSGVCFGLMSFGYPTFLFCDIILLISLCINNLSCKRKGIEKIPVGYGLLGAGTVLALLFIYLAHFGISNWFLFNTEIVNVLFSRKDYQISIAAFLNIFRSGLQIYYKVYLLIDIITLLTLLISWVMKRRAEDVFVLCVISEVFLLPLFFWRSEIAGLTDLDNVIYLFHIFLWSFPMIFTLPKRKRWNLLSILIITTPASIAGFLCVGYTSDSGALKAFEGIVFGIVASLVIYAVVLGNIEFKPVKTISGWLIFSVSIFQLVTFYTHSFFYDNYINCNYLSITGPYKGIKTVYNDAFYDRLNVFYSDNKLAEDKTVVVTDVKLLPFYLYDGVVQATFEFSWMPYVVVDDQEDWTLSKLYWNRVSGKPDLIICSEDKPVDGDFRSEFISEYSLVAELDDIKMYRRQREDIE